jgi:hypothetical protein
VANGNECYGGYDPNSASNPTRLKTKLDAQHEYITEPSAMVVLHYGSQVTLMQEQGVLADSKPRGERAIIQVNENANS